MLEAYRVERKALRPGDPLLPSDRFFEGMDDIRQETEKKFEELRPREKPGRADSIFVFRDEAVARAWASRSPERRLFKVTLEPAAVLHEGDWNWLERARDAIAAGSSADEHAKHYWAGDPGPEAVIEWIVSRAEVTEELEVSQEERRAYVQSRIGTSSEDIADGFRLDGI
jgi:hypothetical protein